MSQILSSSQSEEELEYATFAGGCFWCLEPPFDALDGILETVVGYTGGEMDNPDYESICTGKTGHAEAVRTQFDRKKISYRQLLDTFWRNIDPTTLNRQFFDVGSQYRTVIYYHSLDQKNEADESLRELAESKRFQGSIATQIEPAMKFYPAEEYHQDYYKKCPMRYSMYKSGSGRDQFLKSHWNPSQKL